MTADAVTPLDPHSDKGRETAARLSVIFAQIRDDLARRKAREAARRSGKEPTAER